MEFVEFIGLTLQDKKTVNLSSPSPLIRSGVGPVKYRTEQDCTEQALASPFTSPRVVGFVYNHYLTGFRSAPE